MALAHKARLRGTIVGLICRSV